MHPILFEIPGVDWPIFSYGVMLGLSIILGWYLTLGLGERDGLPRHKLGSCYFWSILGALTGARVLYLIANPSHFHDLGDLIALRDGGLVVYGGFLGGLAGAWGICRVHKIRLWALADVAAPSLALGLAITRIGCFLYGCCYGRTITDDDPGWLRSIAVRFPNWSVRFPQLEDQAGACSQDVEGAPAFIDHVEHLGLDEAAEASLEVVPTQIIASANGWIALALLMFLRRYRRFRGLIFLSFGVYYGLTRFLLEIVRDDAQRGTMGPAVFGPLGGSQGQLTTSQIIALVTVAASAVGLALLARRARRDPQAAMDLGEAARETEEEPSKPRRPRSRGSRKSRRKKR